MKNETIKTITTTVTEINPCAAPDGCPELEPWMAYVGFTDVDPHETILDTSSDMSGSSYAFDEETDTWCECYYNLKDYHYAVDVRTAWAKEHFAEHCRIRNYQEPDAFEDLCDSLCLDQLQHADGQVVRSMMKMAYELNPQPTK